MYVAIGALKLILICVKLMPFVIVPCDDARVTCITPTVCPFSIVAYVDVTEYGHRV